MASHVDSTIAGSEAPAISVILATAARPRLLWQTLDSLARCEFDHSRLQVVVVDNAGDRQSRAVCAEFAASLPIVYLVESEGGKNAALNRGLDACCGELVAFIDDDVIVARDWLDELVSGAGRWPSHRVFGGPISPRFPAPCPAYLDASEYRFMMFTTLDHGPDEGPDWNFIPKGPNMAIRRQIFVDGWRYNANIGPGTAASYIMGSETELLRRLREAGHIGVYLPRCAVHHQIRREQLSTVWMLRRGIRYGRMLAFRSSDQGKRWFGAPRWLYRATAKHVARCIGGIVSGSRTRAFDNAMQAAIAFGGIAYHRQDE